MDDRFYFNPYLFGAPFSNIPPNMVVPGQNINGTAGNIGDISPKDFYENGYYYYRYLNEMIDYQIKSNDFYRKIQDNQVNK